MSNAENAVPGDVHALLAATELTDIVFWEQRARRRTPPQPDMAATQAQEEQPDLRISTTIGFEQTALHFRFRVTLEDPHARYVSDVETVYGADGFDALAVPEQLRLEFAEKVAFMAAFAHVRASIYGGAGRLGTPRLVLPLIRLGDFTIGDRLSAEAMARSLSDEADAEE